MRVLIIGTGWFGCEIASVLDEIGIKFEMLDRSNSFFSESSSKNQNRLHFGGFHYCRSHDTRVECRSGFDKFTEKYSEFSEEIDSFYVVAKKSILDHNTYKAIYEHEGSPFNTKTIYDMREKGIDLNNSFVDGKDVLLVKEHWINYEKARDYFTRKFHHSLLEFDNAKLHISEDANRIYYDNISYDITFDATYGKLKQMPNSFFEACLTLVYRRLDDSDERSPGLTVVDGEFYSLYPYKRSEGLYTLTHVKYTPLFQSESSNEVEKYISDMKDDEIFSRRCIIESDVSNSFVNFLNSHVYHSHFISVKTKFNDVGCADRSTRIMRRGNILSLCGGKITGACDIRESIERFVHNRLKTIN